MGALALMMLDETGRADMLENEPKLDTLMALARDQPNPTEMTQAAQVLPRLVAQLFSYRGSLAEVPEPRSHSLGPAVLRKTEAGSGDASKHRFQAP